MPSPPLDIAIVGAGIAGLLFAREARALGLRVALLHGPAASGASEASVGLLNPVRGQRCTLAWRAPEIFEAARETYAALSIDGQPSLWRPIPVTRAFANSAERAAFERRAPTIAAAGFAFHEPTQSQHGFRPASHGRIAVLGGGTLDVPATMARLRLELQQADVLEPVPPQHAEPPDTLHERLEARARALAPRVVFAVGAGALGGACSLPGLRAVRGESLLLRIPALDDSSAYVCGHHLAPLPGGLWACGGTKAPGQNHTQPTQKGRAELEDFLIHNLDTPWEIAAHRCGVRAATADTRPLLGPMPGRPLCFVFNGLGSQGISAAPWLARALAAHLACGAPLPTELDPARFLPPRPSQDRWHAVEVAHRILNETLAPGDFAIDLTAGTGGDTLALARAAGPEGEVLAIDIQPEAIEATRRRLETAHLDTPLQLHLADHADLPHIAPPHWVGRVGAIVANLGYLPGSTSTIITRPETTLAACSAALNYLRPAGALVVVIYCGHHGGTLERRALENWAHSLDRNLQVTWLGPPQPQSQAPAVLHVRKS